MKRNLKGSWEEVWGRDKVEKQCRSTGVVDDTSPVVVTGSGRWKCKEEGWSFCENGSESRRGKGSHCWGEKTYSTETSRPTKGN